MAKLISNVILFQLGWFASVLSASYARPGLGMLVVALVVSVHLAIWRTPREWILILVSAVVGAILDTALFQSGLVRYEADGPFEWAAPMWIVAMWANFAITLRHALSWLESRSLLAASLGALAGPLAYWGASRLGAVTLAQPVGASVALAVIWGVSLPALLWLSARTR